MKKHQLIMSVVLAVAVGLGIGVGASKFKKGHNDVAYVQNEKKLEEEKLVNSADSIFVDIDKKEAMSRDKKKLTSNKESQDNQNNDFLDDSETEEDPQDIIEDPEME